MLHESTREKSVMLAQAMGLLKYRADKNFWEWHNDDDAFGPVGRIRNYKAKNLCGTDYYDPVNVVQFWNVLNWAHHILKWLPLDVTMTDEGLIPLFAFPLSEAQPAALDSVLDLAIDKGWIEPA